MLCPQCNIEMKTGQVIYPYELKSELTHFTRIANKDNLKLVKCLKCPSCGNSKEILRYDDGTIRVDKLEIITIK